MDFILSTHFDFDKKKDVGVSSNKSLGWFAYDIAHIPRCHDQG